MIEGKVYVPHYVNLFLYMLSPGGDAKPLTYLKGRSILKKIHNPIQGKLISKLKKLRVKFKSSEEI